LWYSRVRPVINQPLETDIDEIIHQMREELDEQLMAGVFPHWEKS